MIKSIKASKSEKILFIFLISLAIFIFTSFFLLKNKCLFVEKNNLDKLKLKISNNIAVMNLECGNVIIELYPDISPKAVERFKILIEQKMYDGSAFYKVSENTFVQAGDIEYGNISNLNYLYFHTRYLQLVQKYFLKLYKKQNHHTFFVQLKF